MKQKKQSAFAYVKSCCSICQTPCRKWERINAAHGAHTWELEGMANCERWNPPKEIAK